MSAKILKKITLKEMGLDKMALLDIVRDATPVLEYRKNAAGQDVPKTYAPKGPPVAIAQFVGNITGIKPGMNKDTGQPYVKLIGSYEAVNLVTGEAFSNCATLMLPDFIANGLATAIQSGAASVDFAVKLFANYDEKSAVMYEFSAESLMPTEEADAVSAIKARLAGMGVALAAPKVPLQLVAPAQATLETEPAAVVAPAADSAPEVTQAPKSAKGGRK